MTTTNSSVTTTLSPTVDDLVLTGSADINGTGNTLNNTITGNSGANVLDGRGGADTLAGGGGNDTYVVDNAGDRVLENAGEGSDTVQAGVSYTLADNVENLILSGSGSISGTGNALDNVITGNNGANILSGLDGNDTLVGAAGNDILDGGTGVDTMSGGTGDDVYVVDAAGDIVVEAAGAGIDTVQSSIDYTLGDTLENLTLTGSADLAGNGNALNNVITGNSGANTLLAGAGADTVNAGAGNDILLGGDGNDTLNGQAGDDTLYGEAGNDVLDGGLGGDVLDGGSGNDTYVVDDGADLVLEAEGAGIDTVQSGINTTLTDNVENLVLTGSAQIEGSGNALDNLINGNSGANVLVGLDGNDTLNGNGGDDRLAGGLGNDTLDGGAGADRMDGGLGDDTYIVDNSADLAVETAGEGIDKVLSSANYTLGAEVENLTLTGSAGTGAGNEFDNTITGNNSNNTLLGMDGADVLVGNAGSDLLDGGLGADAMDGGIGDDTYVVDDLGDRVTELAGAGNDTTRSSIGYTLTDNVENLVLLGADNLDGTGNALANVITGNAADNSFAAGGGNDTVNAGAGNDILFGEAGNDILDGGIGADRMEGGSGDDTYILDDAGDLIVESAGAGTDLVNASVSYTLTDNVENLTLTGTLDIDGNGNELNNIINGNIGANVLDGKAGNDTINGNAGADTLIGGEGDDALHGDAGDDQLQGDTGNDVLNGDAGADILAGGEGDDALNGDAGDDQLQGDAGNDVINGGLGADRMAGGTGDDVFIVDNVLDLVTENAGEGLDTVQSGVDYTLTANVENLVLTGSGGTDGTGNELDNVVTGNIASNALSGLEGNDTLVGLAGNDTLDGGFGADLMQGGSGNDAYIVDNAGDVVEESAGFGTDTVYSSIDYTLTANVDNLTLTGSEDLNGAGNALNNLITGNSGNNTASAGDGADTVYAGAGNDLVSGGNGNDLLYGESGEDQLSGDAGNDTLDGGAGADRMAGGLGDDTFVVDDNGDLVVEAAGEGADLVQSSITYTLTDNVENLTLTGTLDIDGNGNELNNIINGNAGANILDGKAGNDTIFGNLGNDTLIGDSGDDVLNGDAGNDRLQGDAGNDLLNGGSGADTMAGGIGDDVYVVDNAGDLVGENAGEGSDTVQSSINYTLTGEVENLTLTGSALINGSGNALDNVVTGNNAANLLFGADGDDSLVGNGGDDVLDGGSGADNLQGGIGNDSYIVEDANDLVIEAAGAGTDTVQSSIDYSLTANVENLVLTGASLVGTGNALANAITGNAGNNLIDGGAGVDTMSGGAGDDTYIVDASADVASEAANAGVDLVYASASYTLSTNVENLVLTGAAAISGTGNAQDNIILGNNASNVLNGMAGNDIIEGGAGNDTLNGGSGADTMAGGIGDDVYVVDNAGDLVGENAGEGSDTVQSSINYTLTGEVENLTLTGSALINGSGNALDNVVTGNNAANLLFGADGDDSLVGNGGDDVLDGGSGADNLRGGIGNDSYIVEDANDLVIEAAGAGTDTVQSSIDYSLTANVENLVLTGASLVGTGNALANAITGNAGNNLIDGGAGVDTMSGGAGDDIYIVDASADVASEAANAGVDLVYASASYTLSTNVEHLVLTGAAAISGTGNAQDNLITGNDAANVLSGMAGNDIIEGGAGNDTLDGGSGVDVLTGGTGNDTYVIDNAGDLIIENAGEGVDTAQSSFSTTLGAQLENLTLTGSANLDGSGNAFDNLVTGNAGNNVLDGGAGNDTLFGGAGNDTLIGGAGADSLQGGSGDDSYEVDAADTVVEAAGAGTDTVRADFNYSLGANVENLVLLGDADLNGTGNTLVNAITGTGGANVLDGGLGADTLAGGAGDDTYIVDNGGDVVVEAAGNGDDTVLASASYQLSANVEHLVLTGATAISGTGNAQDNLITGNDAANVLSGMAGNDIIEGGAGNDTLDGGSGVDVLTGGTGNDTYVIDNAGDLIIENAGEGVDTAQSSFSTTLGAQLENLTLTGSANLDGSGNAFDNLVTGNAGNNVLDGGAGNDTLFGGAGNDTLIGGAGADSLQGGSGDDSYEVDAADTVVEAAGAGTDTVRADFNYSLGANVENLVLLGDADLNGTGNTLVNAITGTGGANVLDGGLGADTLAGGAGDDTYIVDNSGDVVTEAAGDGDDTVLASASYQLSANVEHLVLTGSAAINGAGNALDNTLTGNSGANLLDGGAGNDLLDGGVGTDLLQGGAGNDVYLVDNIGDTVVEAAGGGTDTVYASASHVLGANVDNLVLTGDASLQGTGNASDNILTGNDGDNLLSGMDGNDTLAGGAGKDLLQGGAGNDTYLFGTGDGNDRIVDAQGSGTLVMRGGLVAADLHAEQSGNDLVLTIVATGDSIVLADWLVQSEGVTQISFDDGSTLDQAGIAGLLNAAPTAADDLLAVSEDDASVTIPVTQLLANDSDPDLGDVVTVISVGESAIGAAIGFEDGQLVYGIGDAYQGLAAGETVEDSFSYTISDAMGETSTAVAHVTIIGANDAAVTVADAGATAEDSAAAITGNVLANDSDLDNGTVLQVAAPGTIAGVYGNLTLAQDGSYSYALNADAANVQGLNDGDIVTDTFAYVATDGIEGVASNLTITIAGANDAPVVSADVAQAGEDGTVAASGNVLANDHDADTGAVLAVAAPGTWAGAYGTLALAQDGSYTYSLDNSSQAVQTLAAGQSVVDSFSYVATDGQVQTASGLSITITGSNDAPVVAADVARVGEDSTLAASGNVLANDHDVDGGAVLAVAAPGSYAGAYGTLVLAQDGSYTYSLDNTSQAVQALAAGQTVVDSFDYVTTDGQLQAASSLAISIMGSNDAPVVTADVAQVSEESLLSASGNVLANDHDVDAGAVLAVAAPGTYVGAYGTLDLAQDGSYTYSLDNASHAVQALAEGQTVVDSFSYLATDGQAQVASNLDITVTGTNDAPVLGADNAHLTEDQAGIEGNVLANDHDVDAGTTLAVTNAGSFAGEHGTLTLGADGAYSYKLDAAAAQSLGRNAGVAEHFVVKASDGIAGAASNLDISVAGVNDAPIVVKALADHDVTFNKAFSFALPADSFKDIDQGDKLTYTAALADGAALPSWLKFNAATGTFSGTSPKQVGKIDVRVTATDAAADGSTAGSLSASDVFTLAVSHGNEGLGNGEDAPPAGHDVNQNDGPGTAPGNPGSAGGKKLSLSIGLTASNGVATLAVSASVESTGATGTGSGPVVPSYLDFNKVTEYALPASSIANSTSSQSFGLWLAVDLAVSQAQADKKSLTWTSEHNATDTSVLAQASVGFLGSTTASGSVSLAAIGGVELKGFEGLGKGLKKIK